MQKNIRIAIVVIVIILLAVIGFFVWQHNHKTVSYNTTGWQTFQDKTYNFNFKYPATWTPWTGNTDAQVQINAPTTVTTGDYTFSVNALTSFFTAPKQPSSNMASWLTYETQLIKGTPSTKQAGNVSIGGQSAVHFEQTATDNTFNDTYLFVKNNTGYYIEVSRKGSATDTTEAAILSTFQFTK
jgi:hypothetical protein